MFKSVILKWGYLSIGLVTVVQVESWHVMGGCHRKVRYSECHYFGRVIVSGVIEVIETEREVGPESEAQGRLK